MKLNILIYQTLRFPYRYFTCISSTPLQLPFIFHQQAIQYFMTKFWFVARDTITVKSARKYGQLAYVISTTEIHTLFQPRSVAKRAEIKRFPVSGRLSVGARVRVKIDES